MSDHSESVPDSLELDIPGSVGQVVAVGLHEAKPWVTVNGEPAAKSPTGAFKVPTHDGRTELVKIKAFIPGRPTITRGKETLYRAPGTSGWMVPLATLAAAAGVFAGLFILPGYVTTGLGVAAAVGAVGWMSNNDGRALVRYGPIVGGSLALIAIGILGMTVW